MSLLASIFLIATFASAEPKSAPTPIAADTSPTKQAPAPSKDDPETSFTEDDMPTTVENGDLPEPFFCQSIFVTSDGKDRWTYFGSDFPREVPPLKAGLLSAPLTQQSKTSGLTWGTCAEANDTKIDSTIELALYGYLAKTDSAADPSKCAWKTKGKSKTEQKIVRLKIGMWAGVEFETANKEKIRFSAHWPTRTQPDTTGEFCRQFAQAMNNKSFDASELKKLKLKLP